MSTPLVSPFVQLLFNNFVSRRGLTNGVKQNVWYSNNVQINNKIKTVSINDKAYPSLLRQIPQPPTTIYYLGSLSDESLALVKVAIVGTRRATRYGLETTRVLARDLSHAGISVVSGLALGIDCQAHQGALEGKTPTWAVLGSGLNYITPTHNQHVAQKIVDQGGALISEFPPDHPPEKWTFPQRNRIIAGLSQATIVVEAPQKSGALITARLALDYNRDVGAVPGEISSINSQGTNILLKTGAAVIRSADDILELLGIQATEAPTLDKNKNNLLNLLDEPMDANSLAHESGLEMNELNQELTVLELRGLIKNNAGLFYRLKNG